MPSLKDNIKLLQEYEKSIKSAKRLTVAVGLPKDKVSGNYEDGSTIIEVGAVHEFGLGKVPQRSFLRVPLKENNNKISTFIAKEWSLVFDGKTTTEKALNKVGMFARNISVGSFRDNNWAPLHQMTEDRKGSSTPLIDTGNLRQSITWVVR